MNDKFSKQYTLSSLKSYAAAGAESNLLPLIEFSKVSHKTFTSLISIFKLVENFFFRESKINFPSGTARLVLFIFPRRVKKNFQFEILSKKLEVFFGVFIIENVESFFFLTKTLKFGV